MTELELGQLIQRAKDGEPEAYDALVDAFSRRLHGYLYRLTSSRDDADELLQELFLRVVRTIRDYRHDGRFEAWLFRIATNLARDRIRRARRTPSLLGLDPAADGYDSDARLPSTPANPDAKIMAAEAGDAIQQALAQLPPAEREVVMLRHFSDLSFADIAAAMGTPLGTALARGHRGLAKLREMLTGQADVAT